MLKAGASGYLTKDRSSEELVRALRKILRGEKYVIDSLAQNFVSDIDKSAKAPHELLSNREFAITKMIAAGKPPASDCKTAFPKSGHGQYVPRSHSAETEGQKQRRTDSVRAPE